MKKIRFVYRVYQNGQDRFVIRYKRDRWFSFWRWVTYSGGNPFSLLHATEFESEINAIHDLQHILEIRHRPTWKQIVLVKQSVMEI